MALVVGAYLMARSSVRLGPDTLGRSVAREADAPFYTWCQERRRSWRCVISPGSRNATYAVVTSGRCWRARRVSAPGATETPLPARLEGCLGVRDAYPTVDLLGPSPIGESSG